LKTQLKIGAYLRVSTDRQVQVFEGSLDTQKYRMLEFVKNKNKEVKNWGEIVEFYVDEGLSAGTVKRPQYQKLMTDVRNGKVNLILVADISRLSRSVHDFSILLKELEQCNASYLSMKEQFDTTTPAGRLMINMVVNMAQFEREQTSERVSINVSSRAMRGFVSGGKTPFGYDRDKDRPGSFLVNEKEAKDIRTVFRVFLEQGSVGKTIPVIEALGIFPRPAKSKKDGLVSKKWGYDQLKDLLSNPAYIGIKEVNKKQRNSDPDTLKPWQTYQQVKASWPAIVKENEYREVQNILEENLQIERRRVEGSERRIFLLSGILQCGECGRALTGQSSHGSQNVHRYYAHVEKRISNVSCAVKRLRADEVEQAVVNHFTEAVSRARYFDNLEMKLAESTKGEPARIKEEIDRAKEALANLEKEIAATFRFQLQSAGGTEAAHLTAQHLEKLGRDKKIVMNRMLELEEIEHSQKDSAGLRNVIEINMKELKRCFHKATPATKRRLIRKVLWKLVYQPKGLDAYFNFEEGHSSLKPASGESGEMGKLVPFKQKKQAEPALNLSFEFLRVEGIGWGSRT
tara:strand:- start:25847 stop:27562 length:1716 start_codon:yes stop_codon:yes gene_type:complete